MTTELCSGSLQDYAESREDGEIKYQGARFKGEKTILHQTTKGLAHLHWLGIAHRDIKQTNILIFLLKSGEVVEPQIKLADFGISNIRFIYILKWQNMKYIKRRSIWHEKRGLIRPLQHSINTVSAVPKIGFGSLL